ncbi:hypothetical protein LCGC14_1024930 [marine sediment metagenome]|uniref:Uncharacterized protein n=1 Tax=marine sediment metagenome TaxID=412755 RepID=A0A0F9NHZ2_9ZZZZ
MNTDSEKSPLNECIEFIENYKREGLVGDTPYSEGEEAENFDITGDRIFKIPECDEMRKLGFVDGGTASILSAADFSISLTRIAGAVFKNDHIIDLEEIPEVIEFYSATILEPMDDGKLAYSIRLFPRESGFKEYLPTDEIVIKMDEVRMLWGFRFRPNIETFGGVAMRFAEWFYAIKFIETELDNGDIFVRDGSLQTGYKDEILLVRDLHSIAMTPSKISGLYRFWTFLNRYKR